MAVINNLSASITSFQVNGSPKNFLDCLGTYDVSTILNGGETYDELENTLNILSYGIQISGLLGHIVKQIIVNSLLLDLYGELNSTKRFLQTLDGVLVNADIVANTSIKTIHHTTFNINLKIETLDHEFVLEVANSTTNSCFYCLESITIILGDVNYKIHLRFFGPNKERTVLSIKVSAILANLDAIDVTFSKDPTTRFNEETDSEEGKIYFRENGIYVDGYLYGVNALADENTYGSVKISYAPDKDENGVIIPPTEGGIAASTLMIYDVVLDITNGVILPPDATNDAKGVVMLLSTFTIDGGGIVPPVEAGIAATPQLVFNALASAKNYTDELITPILEFLNGIEAPLNINIENDEGEKESLGEELTFSNDFELKDKKLYIKWIEITSDGKIN